MKEEAIFNVPIYKHSQLLNVKQELKVYMPNEGELVKEIIERISESIDNINGYYDPERDPYNSDGGYIIIHLPRHGIENTDMIKRVVPDVDFIDVDNDYIGMDLFEKDTEKKFRHFCIEVNNETLIEVITDTNEIYLNRTSD